MTKRLRNAALKTGLAPDPHGGDGAGFVFVFAKKNNLGSLGDNLYRIDG